MGEVAHPHFRDTPCRKVADKGHDMTDACGPVAHHFELQPLRVKFAVSAGFNQLPLPAVMLVQ